MKTTTQITIWAEPDGTISGNVSSTADYNPSWQSVAKETIIKEISIFLESHLDI